MKQIFIVIEGMDGVGKTTITTLLSNKLNAKKYKIPPKELSSIREYIDNSNDLSRFFYYLSAVFYVSEQIKLLVERGESVVCDRYYPTTFSAYDQSIIKLVNKLEIIKQIYQPDFCFLLTVSEEERIKRLHNREYMSNDDIESINNDSLREKQMKEYYKMNMIQIDTTSKTEDEIIDEILKIIDRSK